MLSRSTLALLVLLCTGLLGGARADSGFAEPVYGEWVGASRLGIAMEEHLHPGGEVVVRLYVENRGDTMAPLGKAPDFTLIDDGGTAVPLTLREAHLRDGTVSKGPTTGHHGIAPPKGFYKRDVRLDLLFDTSLAGRYRARAIQRVFDMNQRAWFTLSSPEVSLELTEEE
jgi:hypothetical protein